MSAQPILWCAIIAASLTTLVLAAGPGGAAPAAAALASTSTCEAMLPRNLPPLFALRHVPMSEMWGWYSTKLFTLGNSCAGCER